MPEYCRDWPLWENSTPTWDVGYSMAPTDYGLSQELTLELAQWNDLFDRHFDHCDGWTNERCQEAWTRKGLEIAHRLALEVREFAEVSYEPWPVAEPEQVISFWQG